MHALLKIIKHQNELLANTNKKLSEEISEVKSKYVVYISNRRSRVTSKS